MGKMNSSQGYFNEKMLKILEKGEEKATKKTTAKKATKPSPKKKGK